MNSNLKTPNILKKQKSENAIQIKTRKFPPRQPNSESGYLDSISSCSTAFSTPKSSIKGLSGYSGQNTQNLNQTNFSNFSQISSQVSQSSSLLSDDVFVSPSNSQISDIHGDINFSYDTSASCNSQNSQNFQSTPTGPPALPTKPPYSYKVLIQMAINSTKNNIMPLKEIYKYVETNFPFYKTAKAAWKNSVRHNLSLHDKIFEKVNDEKISNGQSTWKLVDGLFKNLEFGGKQGTQNKFQQNSNSLSGRMPHQKYQVQHMVKSNSTGDVLQYVNKSPQALTMNKNMPNVVKQEFQIYTDTPENITQPKYRKFSDSPLIQNKENIPFRTKNCNPDNRQRYGSGSLHINAIRRQPLKNISDNSTPKYVRYPLHDGKSSMLCRSKKSNNKQSNSKQSNSNLGQRKQKLSNENLLQDACFENKLLDTSSSTIYSSSSCGSSSNNSPEKFDRVQKGSWVWVGYFLVRFWVFLFTYKGLFGRQIMKREFFLIYEFFKFFLISDFHFFLPILKNNYPLNSSIFNTVFFAS